MNSKAYAVGQFIRNASLKTAEAVKTAAAVVTTQTKDVTTSFVAGVQNK